MLIGMLYAIFALFRCEMVVHIRVRSMLLVLVTMVVVDLW